MIYMHKDMVEIFAAEDRKFRSKQASAALNLHACFSQFSACNFWLQKSRGIFSQNCTTLKVCALLKIENNSSEVNFTHFLEKTHSLAFELIFVSLSWRVYLYIKFDI